MSFLPNLPNQKSKFGIYFHVPFCPHICPYCDFVKTSKFTKKDVDAYFEGMQNQLKSLLNEYKNNNALLNSSYCTVYFGGGTPSLFPAKYYEPLLKIIKSNFLLEEVSIETNPFTNRQNFIADYQAIGFNRVTLGAQSLCSATLKTLGRKHMPKDIINNIKWLREAGIEQIQVDLIYGLQEKRSLSITDEVKTLIDAGATGISAYGLTIEARTIFGQSSDQITNEDNAITEYLELLEVCKNLGLKQIETSNFSFYPAKHNQIYWSGYPYFGIGTGAHGLLPSTETNPFGIRYKVGSFNKEIAPGNDELIFQNEVNLTKNFEFIYEDTRTHQQNLEELIFTLLRTENGIEINWLAENINSSIEKISQALQKSEKLTCAFEAKSIFISSQHLRISTEEKIRGDMWALLIIQTLQKHIT